jgi:hypothetical protein
MAQPKPGQLWLDCYRREYFFVKNIRTEDPVYSGWVYWHNINTDYDSDASMDWFLKNCQLVSG